jgi:hypothetical protein
MSQTGESDFFSTGPAEGYYVCEDCIDDETIKAFIRHKVEEQECSFCERSSEVDAIAAPLDAVAEFMHESISREYQRAVEALGWDGREGGYQGAHWDSRELLDGVIGLSLPNDDGRLMDVLADCFGDEPWCERDPYSLREDEALIFSWDHFCDFIKGERRYFFLQEQGENKEQREHLNPAELLEFIGKKVAECGMIKSLPPGTLVYRARQQKPGENLQSPYELGPPATNQATRSNRMSPAGIVMFYVSDDPETAQAEIDDNAACGIVTGTFCFTRQVSVLDLTELPERVPFFDPDYRADRYTIAFLHEFVQSMAARVEPGEREQIDYVPSQVVTEWFRSVFRHGGSRLDGIRYPSAQRARGTSLVLFANRNDLVLTAEQIKEIVEPGVLGEWGLREQHKTAWLELLEVRAVRVAKSAEATG